MSKKQSFIEYVKPLINEKEMSEDAQKYWKAFISVKEEPKTAFTENGAKIMKFLQEHPEVDNWRAKDIGEGLFTSGRSVSTSMRRLVTDEYVEKVGENPVVYMLTEKGKNVIVD